MANISVHRGNHKQKVPKLSHKGGLLVGSNSELGEKSRKLQLENAKIPSSASHLPPTAAQPMRAPIVKIHH